MERKKPAKYQIAKANLWLSLKKRAAAEGMRLEFDQRQFFQLAVENLDRMKEMSEKKMTPYFARKDENLPYELSNLELKERERSIKGVTARKGGETLAFESLRAAQRMGYSRNSVVKSIDEGKPYKGYQWGYSQ